MPLARVVLYAATLGGVLLTVHSVLSGAPDLWLAVACFHVYVALILAGVFFIRLRMFTNAILRGPGDADGIVLTFDDGPDPVHTRKVLDLLDAHEAKATFFVIGRKVEAHPELAREILERGHELGVHGYAHDRLFSLRGAARVKEDLLRAVKVLEAATNRRPRLFRPPIGHTNPTIARVADELDLTVIGWSVAGYDGLARAKPSRVAARVIHAIDDGDIVLLHDAAERDDHEPAGVEALPTILDGAKAKNLRFAHLTDWLED